MTVTSCVSDACIKKFEEGYAKTIPVKSTAIRTFMGKTVPYGATHYIHRCGFTCFLKLINNKPYVYLDTGRFTEYTLIDLECTYFYGQEVKPIPQEEKIMIKEFKKSDLRSGMKVILRNGWRLTVFKETSNGATIMVSASGGRWRDLEKYDENLCFKNREFSEQDIIAVYTVYEYEMLLNVSIKDAKEVLWKRELKTPEQIAYEALQAKIAEEEERHKASMQALKDEAEKLLKAKE